MKKDVSELRKNGSDMWGKGVWFLWRKMFQSEEDINGSDYFEKGDGAHYQDQVRNDEMLLTVLMWGKRRKEG